MVLPVRCYRYSDDEFACESAFVVHLKELMPRISEFGDGIIMFAPEMSKAYFEENRSSLCTVDSEKEKIYYQKAFDSDISRTRYFLTAPFRVWPKMWKAVKKTNVIHSGPSQDPLQLFEIISLIMGVIAKKKTIFVIDIDHRNSAYMNYKAGNISRKSYWLKKYIYDPLFSLQIKFAVRYCSLLLLKSKSLVDVYGKKKPHIKNFYDTVHSASMVIGEKALQRKIVGVNRGNRDIKLVYFGRIVEYKGISDMILAVQHLSADLEANNAGYSVSLTIIGTGEHSPELEKLAAEKEMSAHIIFKDAIPYGPELFKVLQQCDFLLAAPKHEDTPRSAFDAMACALPIIAYDTYYYEDLEKTGAVKTVPWCSIESLAEKIKELANQPDIVIDMMKKGKEFAIDNTQEIWIEKRKAWTDEFLS